MNLADVLRRAAARFPQRIAAVGPEGVSTFAELNAAAGHVACHLRGLGVEKGGRVAVWMEKSVAALAALQGALRAGAAYVPCDPLAPTGRVAAILRDCGVSVLVVSAALADRLAAVGIDVEGLRIVRAEDIAGAAAAAEAAPAGDADEGAADGEDLAYILYTSGSTGRPKGVCISHRAVLAFIEWAAGTIGAGADDRFANHAPLSFDLSVLDVYAAWSSGARVVLLAEELSYDPRRLVEAVVAQRITVWYSVPSALMRMIDRGRMLEAPVDRLRAVLFAGEPFPVRFVRALRQRLPGARLWNLYGPTETNVCTAHEVRHVDENRLRPVPIGRAVCGDRVWAVGESGREAAPGEEGELMVSGPTVMSGYWGREPLGERPYATGDWVRRLENGEFEFIGRRDGQVKLHGHRIELGEVEAALLSHPGVQEAAAVVAGEGQAAGLVAFIVVEGDEPPGTLALKRHCAGLLPPSMIPGEFRVLEALPRTANGKVDRVALVRAAQAGKPPPSRTTGPDDEPR